MDERLLDRLNKIHEQIDDLKQKEFTYLKLAAHEKILFAKIYLSFENGSVEDRKQKAYMHPDWESFIEGFVHAETDYLEAKRLFELKMKAYDAEHLTLKSEIPTIKRQL